MHSVPHAHNLHLSHSLLASVYGHGLWRIHFAAVLKCFYLFGLRWPHELLQWNRCVKRERSAAGCVCVCATQNSVLRHAVSLGLSFVSLPVSSSPGLEVVFLQLSTLMLSLRSVCLSLTRSFSLSILLLSVWFGLFVYEVRNAIWLVSYKTRVERAHSCKTNLPFVFMTIKSKWTPLTTQQH